MTNEKKARIERIIGKHRRAWQVGVLGAVAFFSCCIFPLSKYPTMQGLEVLNGALFIVVFCELGSILPYLNLAGGRLGVNLLYSLAAVALGLLCRYLLEYGEISNVYNFTAVNIASFMAGALLLTAASFMYGKHYGAGKD